MTTKEKRALYESIMEDVAKIVKRRLNESLDDLNSVMRDEWIANNKRIPVASACASALVSMLEHVDTSANFDKQKWMGRFESLIKDVKREGKEKEFVERIILGLK